MTKSEKYLVNTLSRLVINEGERTRYNIRGTYVWLERDYSGLILIRDSEWNLIAAMNSSLNISELLNITIAACKEI